ncbi:hypothetical protein [Clostridium sp.]|uniref:hypothetical protein n=1 Tax=Clostridium sp. TaxID=1506 RepID=UPI0029154A77|nr:hypothetical protein [Clostridium sp.]MDU5107028.1 hypothetical protein [Clostridium sp.]
MKRINILRALIFGIGITVLSSNVVFAETNRDNKNAYQTIEIAVVDENLAKKQEEIDYIVFNKNSKEIEEKGFTVVSTGMVNKFVEVRIEPYNEENAEYLYSILGRDMVNVVDGKEAALLETDEVSPDVDLSSPSFSATAIDENILNKQREIDQYVFEGQEAISDDIIYYDTTSELYNKTTAVKEEKSSGLTLPLLIVSVCALGGVAILSTRKKANYKR